MTHRDTYNWAKMRNMTHCGALCGEKLYFSPSKDQFLRSKFFPLKLR